MANKNVNLDAMFMEQFEELTDEELTKVTGGQLLGFYGDDVVNLEGYFLRYKEGEGVIFID
ncbi:ComC/BlpC family leader-containing pheromone/bacteriocin [Lactococcus hircilactis]|uniref:ComC/BlpC family leader-containing pheromone/bacteriocin n=1 Tax=Lactococcus hircilactis TaxID=1494462 RepID=A0A7X1ZA91_9LACT|nr:bacteriocin [Lactococcus hircilactis]MQW40708.1 ComC/BlpC family leader-containing pheromone/bacteriocin [Lactococcus hircilactis]